VLQKNNTCDDAQSPDGMHIAKSLDSLKIPMSKQYGGEEVVKEPYADTLTPAWESESLEDTSGIGASVSDVSTKQCTKAQTALLAAHGDETKTLVAPAGIAGDLSVEGPLTPHEKCLYDEKMRRRDEKAALLLQTAFRGHHGRMKSALALEIMNFSSPHLVKREMQWSQLAIKGLVYTLVGLMILFALYLNLCFGIKFGEEQQRAWLKSFAGSLFMDLTVGIPVQILVLMVIPEEVLKAIFYFVLFVMSCYIVNGIAGSEAIGMSWFENNIGTFMTVIGFG